MHGRTLSAGVEPLHDGVLLGRLLLLGEEVGLGDVVRQRRFGYVDLLASLKPSLFPEQSQLILDCGSYCEMILKFPSYDLVTHHQVVPVRTACIAIGGLSSFLSIRHQALKHEDII